MHTEEYLLKLIDNSWKHCTDSEEVPDPDWSKQIIQETDTQFLKMGKMTTVDFYTDMAAKCFKVPSTEVTIAQRQKIKRAFLAHSYGASQGTIASMLERVFLPGEIKFSLDHFHGGANKAYLIGDFRGARFLETVRTSGLLSSYSIKRAKKRIVKRFQAIFANR